MDELRRVAVLCTATKTAYRELAGVEVYDRLRDARTFAGGMPIVAHPPCRSWSAYCRHQAKPEPGERALAWFCVRMLRECGGVLEQPAHSLLFEAAGLPLPGQLARDGIVSIAVMQGWFGFPTRKPTWLALSGVTIADLPDVPFRLLTRGTGDRIWANLTARKRAMTPAAFAAWLVEVARRSRVE